MKKRFFGLFEAASFYAVYLVSGVVSSVLFLLLALGYTVFEFYSNHMSIQSDVFAERVGEILSSELIVQVLLYNLVIVFLLWLIIWCRKQTLREYAGFLPTRAWNIISAVVSGVSLNLVVASLLQQLPIPSEMMLEYAEEMEELFDGSFIVVLVTAALVAPFVEELVFRGALLRALRNALNTPLAVLVSSALFAFAHVGPIQITYAFIVGVILCVVRLKSGSLWCTVAMHIAFNAANYILLDEALYASPVFLGVCAFVFVAFFVLSCARKKHP